MNTARRPQTAGLIKRVNKTIKILLRSYTNEIIFYWVSHLSMVEFYYDCSVNEASKIFAFEVSCGF